MSYTNGLDKPTDYFNTVLYSGNATARSITGVGFQPDWVWIKGRTTAYNNTLFDAIRGATKRLYSNGTDAESTQSVTLTSFDSDGFSLGNNASVNSATSTFVAWNWLASNTTASNTDGSITSTVSANTTSGFSIVSYTGSGSVTSFGHGLGVAPSMVIIKNRDNTDEWTVFHKGISSGQGYIVLNSTAAAVTGSSRRFRYGDDSDGKIPDSSKVYLGTASGVNTSGEDYIAYCFAEKKGFSKFGSYTGNGNANEPFIYTGFKPAFVIVKRTNTTGSWMMFDNKRNTFNPEDKFLYSDLSNAEGTLTALDFVSNGFKFRNADTFWNASGSTYIYMAFAEEPLVGDNPATAR